MGVSTPPAIWGYKCMNRVALTVLIPFIRGKRFARSLHGEANARKCFRFDTLTTRHAGEFQYCLHGQIPPFSHLTGQFSVVKYKKSEVL